MIAAEPVTGKHRGRSGLLPLERFASNEEEAPAVRGVSQAALNCSTRVGSIVVVGP
jgi:hypothetical protein